MTLRTIWWLVPIALTCALLTAARTSAQELAAKHHHYKLVDLGTLGGPGSGVAIEPEPNVINSVGTVVGGADTPILTPELGCFNPVNNPDCFISHAFVWRGESLKDLGTLSGGNFSFASAINQRGQIAGVSENNQIDPASGNPEFHAVLWENDKILDLGTLGGTASFAATLNDHGQVVGPALNDVPDPYSILGLLTPATVTQTRAFLWERGKMNDLGTLGGPDSFAVFVNDHGQVAGVSYTSYDADPNTGVPQLDPFLWENGKMKDLGNFGGSNGILPFVNGLNNRGQVVGSMLLADNQFFHGFLWNGQMLLDLGALGGNISVARGINDTGDVTGLATLAGDQVNHGFLWRNGVMTDLGTVDGDPCSDALAVSSKGQVVGASQSAAGGCGEWTAAFLWENGGPSVDLNLLVGSSGAGVHLFAGFWVNGRGEIVAGGTPPTCGFAETCGHVYTLIPCDENHADVEGCDYSEVDATTEAPVRSATTATNAAKLSASEMMMRYRSLMANRYRRFGAFPLK